MTLRFALLALYLTLTAAVGLGNGIITGVVVEETSEEPVPFANVVILGTTLGAAADGEGRFVVKNVPVGKHTIAASAVGFATQTQSIEVGPYGLATAEFLLVAVPVEIAPVKVTPAERVLAERPAPTMLIEGAEIAARGASNVQDALRCQTGVSVKTKCPCSNAAEVQIQGMPGKYTRILVDGAPATSDLGSCYGLTHLPTENIARLEVIKGPGSSAFASDALAGVVNVVTKSSSKTGGSASAGLGSFGLMSLGATLDAVLDSTDATVSIARHQSGPADVNHDGNSDFVKADRASFSLKLRQRLAERLTVSFAGGVWSEERHGGNLERIAGRRRDGLYQNPNISQWGPTASVEWSPTEKSALRLRTGYSNYRQRVYTEETWYTAFEDAVHVETELRQQFGARHALTANLGLRYERLVENTRVGATTMRSAGALLHDEIGLGPFEIAPHLRLDLHSGFGSAASPGLVVFYPLGADLTLRGSVGSGHKAPPTFSKLTHFCPGQGMYDFVQNPAIRPERSRGGNLGVEFHPGDAALSVSLFRTDISDMIQERLVAYDSVSRLSTYQLVNLGAVMTRGVEVGGAARLRGVTLRAGYALLDARDTDETTALAYRSRHAAHWQAGYEIRPLHLALAVTGEFVGAMPTQRREGNELLPGPRSPDYTVWNCKLTQSFGSGHTLSAGIDNVFGYVQTNWLDEDVPLWGPTRGRALNAGVRLAF